MKVPSKRTGQGDKTPEKSPSSGAIVVPHPSIEYGGWGEDAATPTGRPGRGATRPRTLNECIDALPRVSTLVISDRYPPDTAGGAEISLHLALRKLIGRESFLVVAFTASLSPPTLDLIDGVQVLRLPIAAPWPIQAWPVTRLIRVEALPSRLSAPLLLLGAIQSVFTGPPGGLADRVRALGRWIMGPRSGLAPDDVTQPAAWHLVALRLIVAKCHPKIIHGDNLYGIMAAVEVRGSSGARLIGQVRDNRFFCVRHNQDPRIDGVSCIQCSLGCIPPETKARARVYDIMARARTYRRQCLDTLDRIIVSSVFLERQIGDLRPRAQIRRITNPVEDAAQVDRAIAGWPEVPGTGIALVGTFKEGKGQARLLREFESLVAAIPDVHLHLAGKGMTDAGVLELIGKPDLLRRITIHGELDRIGVYRLLRSCKIVAIPALWPEPFGRMPLEAALVSRPVVAFSVGGLAETIEHEATGLLVPPGDFAGFLDALVRLALDPVLRRRLGGQARARVMLKHESRAVADQILNLWRAELATHDGLDSPAPVASPRLRSRRGS